MKDPTRLLSGEASDFERELLSSWGAEQPSEEARAKVLAMTGIGAGVAIAAIALKAGATGNAGAALGGSIAPKAGAAGGALAKWLLLGAVGVVAAGGSLAYVRHARHAGAPPAIAGHTAAASVVPSAVASVPGSPLADAPSTAAPTAPAARDPLSPSRAAPSTHHPSPLASSDKGAHSRDEALGEQVSALDAARRTLAGGDAAGALHRLDEYASRFPHGALVEEADALRIEALLAASDRPSATQAGARFLAAHPASPLAPRVRALLGLAPPAR